MTIENWKNSGQYFRYRNQYDVFYQTAGSGPVLVLLHGFPTASWDWHKLWEPLSAHFRVLTFDFIGFGFSDKPRVYHYSLLDQADLAAAFLADQGVSAYHLLAHDYGASVAQELVARHYERQDAGAASSRVLSLAFLNGGIFPGIHRPLPIQHALASSLGFLLTPFLSKSMLRRNFQGIFGPNTQATAQEVDEFYELMSRQRGKYLFHRLIRYMAEREVYQDRWVGAIQRAELPQCLINGAYDPISGRHVGEHYLKIIPQPHVVFLDDIGHYPQTEAPGAVLTALMNFYPTATQTTNKG